MKRLKALCLSVVLSSIISYSFLSFYIKGSADLTVKNNSIRYNVSYEKYNSHDVLVNNINKNTILLLGSSELTVGNDFEEHPRQFLDFSDKNIMQIGGGYYQSLMHSIILGSIGNEVPNKTVNFILSMQWFDKEGANPNAFQPRFSLDHLNNLYRNEKLSKETKEKIYNRILELSSNNEITKTTISRMKRDNYFDKILNKLYYRKYKFICNNNFLKEYKRDNSVNNKKFSKDIDWENLKNKAIERGKLETTNNKYFLENKYFNHFIKNKFKKLKSSDKNITFGESPEYKDLQLFLDVAKELGFKVNLFLVPLQGYWADYTEVPKSEIEKYYVKIRKIAKDNNVNLIDYSEYSYTPYFFKDITHLGRLGLLKLQEDLLKYND